MPCTGTFERSLDEKQRLALPKPLREEIVSGEQNGLFAAPGNDGCLSLYSHHQFQQLAERLTRLTAASSEIRNYLRLFYSQAELIEIDKQGRIRLPLRLVTQSQLKSQVIVVGVGDHVEVWDADAWQAMLTTHAAEFDQLTAVAMQKIGNNS